MHSSRLEQLREFAGAKIGVEIDDWELLNTALTHSSYTKELDAHQENYERCEFLGDAVLKLVISDLLFKTFKNYREGELTKIRSTIVSDEFIAKLALKLEFDKYIQLGPAQARDGGAKKQSILACGFEAVLGAFYLDGKTEEIKDFLKNLFTPELDNVAENLCVYNSKALLQEYIQAKSKGLPVYTVTEECGAAHKKTFEVVVSFENKVLGSGSGNSKKEAEKQAALEACVKLGLIKQ